MPHIAQGQVTCPGMDRKCSYTIILNILNLYLMFRAVKQGAPGVSWEGAPGRPPGCHERCQYALMLSLKMSLYSVNKNVIGL